MAEEENKPKTEADAPEEQAQTVAESKPAETEAPKAEATAEPAAAPEGDAKVAPEKTEAPEAEAAPAQAEAPAEEKPSAGGEDAGKGESGPKDAPAPKPGARRDGRPQRGGRPGSGGFQPKEDDGISEKVLFINRCAKVVKGGRRFSFSALVVVGDGSGKVGIGFGKANEVSECIRKANEAGRKAMEPIHLEKTTIPHEVIGEFGGARVLMRPAAPGTGLIAGGGVRAVAEAAGVKDLLAKSLGSSNPSNVAKAALEGLRQLARKEEILQARGK